ncbi:MAG: hypothetical protein DPW18_09710 [Chloroflexi bacterium]|nr:hypothetical protein [Chloroflexota bacterium]MDL1943763.1 hypothetical protein [Chloroflexi bacterium CFX2]
MKNSHLVRIALLIVMLVGVFSAAVPVQAMDVLPAQIIIRSTTFWDAIFSGTVNSNRYERWSLQIDEATGFSVTVTTQTGDLVPAIYLLDASENEITHVNGTLSETVLTTNQPAGDYFIQVQPVSGGGTYNMAIRKTVPVEDPNVTIVLNPASILVGETATATVFLNNIPQGGYTSAEFTCTYNPALIEVSNIAESGLFGSDAVVALNGPQNGTFIFAIAGSNGRKAATDGAVFAFSVRGLQAGQATIDCQARVSTGGALTTIESSPITLTIAEPEGTLTGTVLATKTVTVTLYNPDSTVADTTTADANGNFSLSAPAGSYTVIASAPGFLNAQGTPTLTAGGTTTMQTVSLPAGDIDGNDVIDQFDALTIGMNYNLAEPDAADLNDDGTINVLDLELLAANYRLSGALAWQ